MLLSSGCSCVQLTDEGCGLTKRQGWLRNTAATAWFNQDGAQVGGGSNVLQKVPAGTYYLQVTDGGTCTVQSAPFTIGNTDITLPAPAYNDLTVPRYSTATLAVKNYSLGEYKLFTGAVLSQQNGTGNFTVASIRSDTLFHIQQSRGSCESLLVPVSIRVVDQSYFTIPNAFTPDNNGRNDQLNIRVRGYIALNYYKIYNRWGQIIFETKDLNNGWNGTWKGVLQPTGAYLWVAEGKDLLGNTVKDKGSVV